MQVFLRKKVSRPRGTADRQGYENREINKVPCNVFMHFHYFPYEIIPFFSLHFNVDVTPEGSGL